MAERRVDPDRQLPALGEPGVGRERAAERRVRHEPAGVVDGDHAERDELARQGRDRLDQVVGRRRRHEPGHEPRRRLVEHPARRAVRPASDRAALRIGRPGSKTRFGERGMAHEERVVVVGPERDPAARGDRLEIVGGRPASPAVEVPPVAEQPGRRIRQRGVCLADVPQACLQGRGGLEVDGAGGDRRLGKVEVRVREPGDRHLVRGQDQPLRPRPGGALHRCDRPGRDDPPVEDRDRFDPAEARPAGEGRDPAHDDALGGGHSATTDAAAGPARKRASASPVSPAPSPAASAIRAFGAPSVPASIAPARTHVPPPPGNA